jgi:hypothetical protein
MFSISHWGLFAIPYRDLECYQHFLWFANLGPTYHLEDT